MKCEYKSTLSGHRDRPTSTLFRNKRFMLDEMTKQNIFIIRKPMKVFFCFSFLATLFFPLMNALVNVDIDQRAFIRGKNKVG